MVKSGLDQGITERTVEISPEGRMSPETEVPINDNLTPQQRERDVDTTILYRQFVNAHKEKQEFARGSKKAIRIFCIFSVSALLVVCAFLSVFFMLGTDRQVSDVVALISAIVPLLIAIIGTLNIVTKHVFPEDEERYITEIVKIIHANDLRNKQENIKSNKSSAKTSIQMPPPE